MAWAWPSNWKSKFTIYICTQQTKLGLFSFFIYGRNHTFFCSFLRFLCESLSLSLFCWCMNCFMGMYARRPDFAWDFTYACACAWGLRVYAYACVSCSYWLLTITCLTIWGRKQLRSGFWVFDYLIVYHAGPGNSKTKLTMNVPKLSWFLCFTFMLNWLLSFNKFSWFSLLYWLWMFLNYLV